MHTAGVDRVNYRLKKSPAIKGNMEELKSLFGEEALNYEQFMAKVGEGNIKLANINAGGYVDKSKLDKQINSNKDLQAKYDELLKNTENYEAITKELNELKQEKLTAGLMGQIRDAKVDDKFAKFVLGEVKGSMGEGDKFEDALAKFVKENPQYLTTRQGVFKFGSSSPDLENGSKAPAETTNQLMNAIFRKRGE